jgi:hypothetical protein
MGKISEWLKSQGYDFGQAGVAAIRDYVEVPVTESKMIVDHCTVCGAKDDENCDGVGALFLQCPRHDSAHAEAAKGEAAYKEMLGILANTPSMEVPVASLNYERCLSQEVLDAYASYLDAQQWLEEAGQAVEVALHKAMKLVQPVLQDKLPTAGTVVRRSQSCPGPMDLVPEEHPPKIWDEGCP